jgi:hypothetical protein
VDTEAFSFQYTCGLVLPLLIWIFRLNFASSQLSYKTIVKKKRTMMWRQWINPTQYSRLRENQDGNALEKYSPEDLPRDIGSYKPIHPALLSLLILAVGTAGFFAGFLVSQRQEMSNRVQQLPGTVPQGMPFLSC